MINVVIVRDVFGTELCIELATIWRQLGPCGTQHPPSATKMAPISKRSWRVFLKLFPRPSRALDISLDVMIYVMSNIRSLVSLMTGLTLKTYVRPDAQLSAVVRHRV